MGQTIKPNGSEEIHVEQGCFLVQMYGEFGMCGKDEWYAIPYAKNITFNDQFVTWFDKEGKCEYRELNGWDISVFPKNFDKNKPKEPKEPEQMTIFDFL